MVHRAGLKEIINLQIIGPTQINFSYCSDVKFMSEIFEMKIFFRKG